MEWEEKPLSTVADFLNGLACQKHPPKNEVNKLHVLKIKELKTGFSTCSDWVTTGVDKKYLVKSGDIIFSWSASLAIKIWQGQDCVLNQHLFKVTSKEFPKWFYYLWIKHYLAKFVAISASHATTMGHIRRGDLDDSMVLVPPKKELQEMTLHFRPLLLKITSNCKQIHSLQKLRETLLPKLISGALRVADKQGTPKSK